ncbi:MAG: 2-succinylbenzoate--CoA ligase [Cyanobacteria bacterium]|nr:2-succinylbenzoate--CoA ligase [Cyanobacteria bacterium CG_2015-16_32_12]NCO77761.1 2-succinylbenzoate--CoA ligase [Cyanobacteria bacterium CG_2015-22_32_23]NCQ03413.1 2-succinylbenzoate--CoA ligase [Cyanobacteria bacterium CG_2015-09_32_10]NCQ43227.1 2-succinylbenzoate--CoA ligase [Cyanobacteria bacterium CG_2015-04_32_10]NCS83384.1 2-succinylbenzoate--CoA ligase [Cyanobacteria bacterium CG_2015-02_32_10]
MNNKLSILSQLKLLNTQWIFNYKSENLEKLITDYITKINCYNDIKIKPIIFIAETESYKFIAAFFASIITNSCVFLINPHWQIREWQQIEKIVKPDIIFGNINYNFSSINQNSPSFTGIMIPTGGTSGKIKFAIHTWETLTASAMGFYQYFGNLSINSYCCLPLYHVSGLMQVIRSFITEGKLVINSFQNVKNNLEIIEDYQDYFISLVPTQLQFFLDNNPQYLTKFKTILVGGASIYPHQILLANKHNIPLALTYGMTETASGISILKPQEIQENNYNNGQILPHAQVIVNEKKDSIIKIKSTSLFKGYYPHVKTIDIFITDDVGYVDKKGYLYILGRNSQKIITGGENIFPLEIERAILATNLVKDVYIIGQKNDYWGEIITAFYVPLNSSIKTEDIKAKLVSQIANYKIPKVWEKVTEIPRNSQGKVTIINN